MGGGRGEAVSVVRRARLCAVTCEDAVWMCYRCVGALACAALARVVAPVQQGVLEDVLETPSVSVSTVRGVETNVVYICIPRSSSRLAPRLKSMIEIQSHDYHGRWRWYSYRCLGRY